VKERKVLGGILLKFVRLKSKDGRREKYSKINNKGALGSVL
jgi:hypothetical protein